MKRQNALFAYILIGIGLFFLVRELKVPIFTDFYSWQTLLIIIGSAFLIYSYQSKNYQHIFTGTLILGIGIHLHGVEHYSFWIDHWGIYVIILGLAFLLRSIKIKSGFFLGFLFLGIGGLAVFSEQFNRYFHWMNDLSHFIERFWPILLILLGIVLLRKNK